MDAFKKTAESIAQKIKLHADVLVFSPVFDCEDALPEEMAQHYQDMYDRCIAQENIDATQIFMTVDGEIFIAANVYSLAGAMYYSQLIPLNEIE